MMYDLNMSIIRENSHLTNQFCGVELYLTTVLKVHNVKSVVWTSNSFNQLKRPSLFDPNIGSDFVSMIYCIFFN